MSAPTYGDRYGAHIDRLRSSIPAAHRAVVELAERLDRESADDARQVAEARPCGEREQRHQAMPRIVVCPFVAQLVKVLPDLGHHAHVLREHWKRLAQYVAKVGRVAHGRSLARGVAA